MWDCSGWEGGCGEAEHLGFPSSPRESRLEAPRDRPHSTFLPHCELGNGAGRAGLVLVSASGLRGFEENNSTLAFEPCLWGRPRANCLTLDYLI